MKRFLFMPVETSWSNRVLIKSDQYQVVQVAIGVIDPCCSAVITNTFG